eukprot:TRINITY_DN2841_c0_g1_i1.p1 TRINITY_DN2841_c0_g1~~TRINITY_DN2841_c0_g1_i1.p1  ORF type:complete len:922 (+),score=301.16 TRINITY_DN2841_c0_g1_i1:143-2908(+)
MIQDSEDSLDGERVKEMWLSNSHPAVVPVEEVENILRTDRVKGLSTRQAEERYTTFGYNELIVKDEEPVWKKYLEQFKNPLIILLLCSAIVSIGMKQYDDAASITLAIIIVVTVGFIQEYRSEKTLEKLKKLVPPVCVCVRDGRPESFEAKFLVPGDLVTMQTGDRIPADLRLVSCIDFAVDESSLTGELEPILKTSDVLPKKENLATNEMINQAFMGTMVVTGRATGLVVATADKTQFGQVFQMMSDEVAPDTPLQNSMNLLGKQLSAYSLVVIGLIMLAGWYQGKQVLVMFNIGVSLAVAAIPEGLPIVTVVTLALGVMRMAGKQAIVKKLPTVEALGCVNVICTDKTGTVTCNQMTATNLVTGGGDRVQVTGSGYHPEGAAEILTSDDHSGTQKDLERLAECATLCNNASITCGQLLGQPTEGALLALAQKLSIKKFKEEGTRVKEIPFSSENKVMEVIYQLGPANVSFVKGALEKVLIKCDTYLHHGKILPLEGSSVPADSVRFCAELGGKGLRVLALARGVDGGKLTFLGLVAMQDPPRPGVPAAVRTLAESGVRTVMLTGDAKETALAIGDQIGLFGDQRPVRSGAVAGEDLDRMGDADLQTVVRSVQVFYRVSPRHKVRIVAALQSHGLIVAMTGDGVNDGVAVKRADVGIAMGKCGTDVCKEAADVILLDDDFSTILCAIEEGKSIFINIRNFLRFQLSTSIAALSLISISTLMGTANPLNPMQILWINIIMDGPPAQSLGVEPSDKELMKKPPRDTKVAMLSKDILINIILSASIIVCGTLYVFKEMMEDGKITNRDTTMTFTCFVFFDMFNALSCRSNTKSVFQLGLFSNKAFCLAVLFSLVGQMLVIYTPPLQYIFQTEALSAGDLFFLVCLTSSILIMSEVKKFAERQLLARRKKVTRTNSAKSLISLV